MPAHGQSSGLSLKDICWGMHTCFAPGDPGAFPQDSFRQHQQWSLEVRGRDGPRKGFPASGAHTGGQRGLDPREDGKHSRGGGLGYRWLGLDPTGVSAAHLWSDPLVWQFRLGVMGWLGAPSWVEYPYQGVRAGGREVWLLVRGGRGKDLLDPPPVTKGGCLVRNRRGSKGPDLRCLLPLLVGICQGTDLQKLGWVWLSGHGLLAQG